MCIRDSIFGARVEDIERIKKEGYDPKKLYEANPEIKKVVDTPVSYTHLDVYKRQRLH